MYNSIIDKQHRCEHKSLARVVKYVKVRCADCGKWYVADVSYKIHREIGEVKKCGHRYIRYNIVGVIKCRYCRRVVAKMSPRQVTCGEKECIRAYQKQYKLKWDKENREWRNLYKRKLRKWGKCERAL